MNPKTPKITVQSSDENGSAIVRIESDNRSTEIYARNDGSATIRVTDWAGRELLRLNLPKTEREYGADETNQASDP